MTYRATTHIDAGPGVRAYNKGDVVPDDAVKNLGVSDRVAKDEAPKKAAAPKP